MRVAPNIQIGPFAALLSTKSTNPPTPNGSVSKRVSNFCMNKSSYKPAFTDVKSAFKFFFITLNF